MKDLMIPVLSLFPLIVCSIWALVKGNEAKKKPQKTNIFILQSIPNFLITSGVLGTFLGIVIGLFFFDINDIENSIGELLSGLKGAFLTSIVGITLSICYSIFVKELLFTKGEEIYVPQSEETKATEEMSKALLEGIKESSTELNNNLLNFANSITQTNTTTMLQFVKRLDGKVDEIILNMNKNNELMRNKFDEFSELLANANVDALKEAFERLITNFNETFQELITNLVDQNFAELTNSVDKLNEWQEKNKSDIERFYHIISTSIDKSDTLLDKIGTTSTSIFENLDLTTVSLGSMVLNTERLIDKDSELVKILNALKLVMIDDKRFIKIATKLNQTSNDLSTASKQLITSSKELKVTSNNFNEINSWYQELRQSIQTLVDLFGEASDDFKTIDTSLSSIVKNTQKLVHDDSKLSRILIELNSVMNDNDGKFQKLINSLLNAVEEFEDEKRMISHWLKREDGIHSSMLIYTESLHQFTEKLKEFDRIKSYDLNVFNETFETQLEASLTNTFYHLDKLMKEYVNFLETEGATRHIKITSSPINP